MKIDLVHIAQKNRGCRLAHLLRAGTYVENHYLLRKKTIKFLSFVY